MTNFFSVCVYAAVQPEVLSRCSTPLTPGGSMLANSIANIAICDPSHSLQTSSVQLPFVETDTSAASKQEHVISVVSSFIYLPNGYKSVKHIECTRSLQGICSFVRTNSAEPGGYTTLDSVVAIRA